MEVDNSVRTFVNYGGTLIENSEGELYSTSQSFGLLKFDFEALLFVQVPLKDNGIETIKNHRYYDIKIDDVSRKKILYYIFSALCLRALVRKNKPR